MSNTQERKSPLTPLDRAFKVDAAINARGDHLVIIRFGVEPKDESSPPPTKQVDEWLEAKASEHSDGDVKIYTVRMKAVPELRARFRLIEPCTLLFFHNNVQVGRLHGDSITESDIKKTIQELLEKRKETRRSAKQNKNQNNNNNNNTEKSGDPPVSSNSSFWYFKRWNKASA